MTEAPHDRLVKETFSKPAHAIAEFRAALPTEVFAMLAPETVRVVSGSFVDEELTATQSDLLYSVEIAGEPGFVYVLFEHQSSVDRQMPFRILVYVTRILSQYLKSSGELPLPAVLPIVLHHSESGWTAATEVNELFSESMRSVPALEGYLPRLRFFLDDISRATDEELVGRAVTESEKIPALVYLALRDSRHRERVMASLAAWIQVLGSAFQTESGRDALLTVLRYLSSVQAELSRGDLIEIAKKATPKTKEVFMTLAEQWMQQGREEGREEGRLAAERGVLMKLLTLKFGPLPEREQRRVEAAESAELEIWTERVLSADTLDAILTDPGGAPSVSDRST